MCIFFYRMNAGVETSTIGQILLFYGSLLTFMGGLITRTVLYREDNTSDVNYGYKLLGEAILVLAVISGMIAALCF